MKCRNCNHHIFELEGEWEHSESFEDSKKCEAEDGDCECINPVPSLPTDSDLNDMKIKKKRGSK